MALTQFDYADLAGDDYPSGAWTEQAGKYERINDYFFGKIFEQTVKPTLGDDSGSPPKLYPLAINIVKMMTLTHTNIFLGQWEDRVFHLRGEAKNSDGERYKLWARQAERVCEDVWLENNLNSLGTEGALSCMLYGGVVYKVSPDPTMFNRVRIEHILPEYFLPRWHPMNPNELLQVYIAFRMSVADAVLAYGYSPRAHETENDTVLYREYWDKEKYEITIGAEEESQIVAEGVNIFRTVPFIYIPRIRAPGEFYGLSVPEDIYGIQDELNMRLADVGDRIQYTAHPVWILKNYTGREDKFAMASDEILNLGVSTSGLEPDLKMVEPPGEPPSTFKYIEFCIDLAKRGSLAPPIAFGEDEGSQRSALTLTFRMWPLVQQAKWARSNWTDGLERLNDLILLIRIVKDAMENRPDEDRVFPSWRSARVIPKFPVLLPKDRSELVTEVLDAWSRGERPLISLETAVEQLSFTEELQEEVDRIKSLWKIIEQAKIAEKEAGASVPFGATRSNSQ